MLTIRPDPFPPLGFEFDAQSVAKRINDLRIAAKCSGPMRHSFSLNFKLVGRSFLFLMQTIADPRMLWPALTAANSMLWPSLRHRMPGLLEALRRVEMKFDFL